jgi:hypothetical protein
MNDLLELAASPNERVIRTRALQYFLDNVKGLYSGQYDPSVDIAFLPTTDDSFQTPLVRLHMITPSSSVGKSVDTLG